MIDFLYTKYLWIFKAPQGKEGYGEEKLRVAKVGFPPLTFMAEKLLYEVTQNDYERAAVFEREKILTDYYAGLASAENKGKKEGIDEGEHNKAIEIAGTMKKQGFSIDQISSITGLTLTELESL